MKNNTRDYYSPKQGRLPLFITDYLDICDPVLTFDRIMEEIEIEKYLSPEPFCKFERPGYNRVNMLKTILCTISVKTAEAAHMWRSVKRQIETVPSGSTRN